MSDESKVSVTGSFCFRSLVVRSVLRAGWKLLCRQRCESIIGVEVLGDDRFRSRLRETEAFIRDNPDWGGQHWDSLVSGYMLCKVPKGFQVLLDSRIIFVPDAYIDEGPHAVILLLVFSYNLQLQRSLGLPKCEYYRKAIHLTAEWMHEHEFSVEYINYWKKTYLK